MSTPISGHKPIQPPVPPTTTATLHIRPTDVQAVKSVSFEASEPRRLKKLYKQAGNLFGLFKSQVVGRVHEIPNIKQPEQTNHGLRVTGIADRLPRESHVMNDHTQRDLIMLGQHSDYKHPVASITINGSTMPVANENGQVVARNLDFGGAEHLSGYITLANGERVPLDINVITAL